MPITSKVYYQRFIPLSGISLIAVAILITVQPIKTSLALILIAGFLILIKTPSLWLPLILIFAVIGELIRLPIGPMNGLLLNDIFIPLLIGIWLITKIVKNRTFPPSRLFTPLLIFILMAFLSLLYNFRRLENLSQILTTSFYLIRFISYACLIPLTIDLAPTLEKKWRLVKIIIISAVILALAGFVQLILISDFSAMAAKSGWDPHIGRLLSTWFDPNFIGGLFALIIPVAISLWLYEKSPKRKFWLTISIIILLIALWLTYSRSSYLTLAFALLIIGFFRSRPLLIVGLLLSIIFLSVSDRAQKRVQDMYYSGLSLLGVVTTENPDPTARLRVESWQQNLGIAKQHWLTGVGYNTLRYVKLNEGYVKDLSQHSAAGSDSSLLTIFTTTGLFGLISYLWLHLRLLKTSGQAWLNPLSSPLNRGLGLGFFTGLLSLLVVHSLFVNSLLFFPLLIYIWILTGLVVVPVNIDA